MIEAAAVTLTRWATTARSLIAQLRGAGTTGEEDPAEEHDEVEVAQPMGLRVRPVQRDSLEALVVERGDERLALFLLDKSRQAGAVEPEAGGTVLHGLAEESAVIYIRANGDIEITPKAGRDVILNAGTLKVARATDAVTAGATPMTGMAVWIAAVTAAINALAPGSIGAGIPSDFGSIDSAAGAPHVKA